MTIKTGDTFVQGVGIVIDDKIMAKDTTKDAIFDLLAQMQERNLPYVQYRALPSSNALKHFGDVSFILLDWELWEKTDADLISKGVYTAVQQETDGIAANITFLKNLREWCFAPVFIFSYLNPEGIKDKLHEAGLMGDDEARSFILVREKKSLKRGTGSDDFPLFTAVDEWIKGNPAVYVLAQWRNSLLKAKNSLFWDLYDASPGWPRILWKAYKDDNDDPNRALVDVIQRNMRGRMEPVLFDETSVTASDGTNPDKDQLRRILESALFVSGNKLTDDQYGCGDLFQSNDNDELLYQLNIRCDCDCIARNGNIGDVHLYLLNGRVVSETDLQGDDIFNDKTGFNRPMNKAFLFPVDTGKCIGFSFLDLKKKKVKDLINEGAVRIGRVTAPHITDIRQRYSLWMQREGISKVPPLSVRNPGAKDK